MADPSPIVPDPGARATLVHMTSGYAYTALLYAAARLGLADVMATGADDAAAIASGCGTHADGTRRLLESLVALGVIEGRGVPPTRSYHLTPVSYWLRRDVPGSQHALVAMSGAPVIQGAWQAVAEALRSGAPAFEVAHGEGFFERLDRDPELARSFQVALGAGAEHLDLIVSACGLDAVTSLVDVGGGDGGFLDAVTRMHPQVRATLLEREAVVAALSAARVAAPREQETHHPRRWDMVAGDFFAAVPTGAERYVLRRVLHDWDDTHAQRILERCREAAGVTGRVLVIEQLMSPERLGAMALLDMTMLVLTGGRERAQADFERLFAAAGLELVDVVATGVGPSVLVGAARTP